MAINVKNWNLNGNIEKTQWISLHHQWHMFHLRVLVCRWHRTNQVIKMSLSLSLVESGGVEIMYTIKGLYHLGEMSLEGSWEIQTEISTNHISRVGNRSRYLHWESYVHSFDLQMRMVPVDMWYNSFQDDLAFIAFLNGILGIFWILPKCYFAIRLFVMCVWKQSSSETPRILWYNLQNVQPLMKIKTTNPFDVLPHSCRLQWAKCGYLHGLCSKLRLMSSILSINSSSCSLIHLWLSVIRSFSMQQHPEGREPWRSPVMGSSVDHLGQVKRGGHSEHTNNSPSLGIDKHRSVLNEAVRWTRGRLKMNLCNRTDLKNGWIFTHWPFCQAHLIYRSLIVMVVHLLHSIKYWHPFTPSINGNRPL